MLGARGANNWCSKLRDSIAQKLVSRQKLLLRPCPSRLILIFQPADPCIKSCVDASQAGPRFSGLDDAF